MKIEVKVLNVARLTKLLIAASRWLSKYADVLNDLNVYPVPDGDTGTNMSMTLQAVENDLVKLNHEPNMEELCDIVSESILLGARGNSGTILSQIIQGFLSALSGKEEVTVADVAQGFVNAKEKAYKAVSEPVEGTMLTVIRRVAEEAVKYDGPEDDFILFLAFLKNVAAEAVEDTPNLLAKLKEAGVVDAGGKGIFYILEGFEKSVTDPEMLKDLERIVQSQAHRREKLEHAPTFEANVEIEFKYCTEFIIESGSFDLDSYRNQLLELGDSVVCAQSSKKTKTHLHTNNPGMALEIAGKLGNLNHIKIDNMEIQHSELIPHEMPTDLDTSADNIIVRNENSAPVAYFAIVDNHKLADLFIESGATAVLIGGQTQNPSVADIEEALSKINATEVVLLPNNKNIISAAKIAAERSDKQVAVLDTTSMLEGHYVVKNKNDDMTSLLSNLKRNFSIEITRAVRDTKVGELVITSGDYIAMINGKILYRETTMPALIKAIYAELVTDDALNIFAVKGKEATEEANKELNPKTNARYAEYEALQENYPYYIYVENRDPNLPEIAIVTDSTSDLNKALLGDLNVNIIPLKIKLEGDRYYRDGVDITTGEFWKTLLKGNVIPKTSQPSPAEFKTMYEDLLAKGYKKIISIHISSKLSGTQQAAKVARGMTGREKDIAIVDSKTVTFALGHMATEAARMVNAGETFENVLQWLEEVQGKMKLYFTVRDLLFLEKGGRIGKASSVVGGMFQIKPVLKVEGGEVCTEKKAIGEAGAMKSLEKLIKAEAKNNSVILYTGWGGTQSELDKADQLKQAASKLGKVEYRGRSEIGGIIGSHSGPVYGVAIFPKIR